MGTSPSPINIPPPPPGFVPEQQSAGAIPPPPPGFVPEGTATTPKAPEQPGFLARASEVALGTQHPIDQAVSEAKQLYNDPVGTLKQATKQAVMMPLDLASRFARHPLDTAKQLTGGPQFEQDVANKNWSGAAGTLFGGIAPLVLGSAEGRAAIGDTAGKVAGEMGDVTQSAAKKIAGPIVRKPPAATANDLKFGRDPAEAIIREPGLEGHTREGLRNGVAKRMQEVGNTMDQTLSTPQAMTAEPTKVGPIIDEAQTKALSTPIAKLNPALQQRINTTADLLRTQFGSLEKSPLEATQMKRAIGEATKWTGQAFDNEANQFLVDVYRGIKDDVNAKVPEVSQFNERYADLLSAKTALDRKIAFDTNRPLSIGRSVLGAMGGGAATGIGYALGGPVGGALGAGVDLSRTTPGRLFAGRTLSKLSGSQYGFPTAPAADTGILNRIASTRSAEPLGPAAAQPWNPFAPPPSGAGQREVIGQDPKQGVLVRDPYRPRMEGDRMLGPAPSESPFAPRTITVKPEPPISRPSASISAIKSSTDQASLREIVDNAKAPAKVRAAAYSRLQSFAPGHLPTGNAAPVKSVYPEEIITQAENEMRAFADMSSALPRPGRYFAEYGEGEAPLTQNQDWRNGERSGGRWYGVTATRPSMEQQFPWFADPKLTAAKVTKAITEGKGADYERIVGKIAQGIQKNREKAAPVVAEYAPELRSLAQQINSIDPSHAEMLNNLADGKISVDFKDLRKYIEENISDAKTAAQFSSAIDSAAEEARTEAGAEETTGNGHSARKNEDPIER